MQAGWLNELGMCGIKSNPKTQGPKVKDYCLTLSPEVKYEIRRSES